MELFTATIEQMIFLFGLIIVGYIVRTVNAVPQGTAGILSKLENTIFIPALIMGTFIKNFTADTMKSAWKILLFSLLVEIIVIPVTIFISKTLSKDSYTQKIYRYGLCFSNFGFMGNAVVSALFPEHFTNYIIFTLVLWSLIYLYGVPALLLPSENKATFKQRLKSFVNPMFISMVIGMILGITLSSFELSLPNSVVSLITVCGDCMSPIAMLLTGITLAEINLKKVLKRPGIYIVSGYRLLIYPLIGLGIFFLLRSFNIDTTYIICTICTLAMPLGLNTIVIPSAYNMDTTTAAGMALISHIASILTIPVIFSILNYLI